MGAGDASRHVTSRPYRGDDDYRNIRELLVATVPLTPLDFNWDVRRWDGWRYYRATAKGDPAWTERVRLWESQDGRAVAAAFPEGAGDAQLAIHPDHRSLEIDMLDWAEAHLGEPTPDGNRQLAIYVHDYDSVRRDLLARRGYVETTRGGCVRRMRLDEAPPKPTAITGGYSLRATRLGDDTELNGIADLLNAAFDRDFHNAAELRVFTARAPSFDPEMDLVAEAPDGSLVAYVGVSYDDVNHRGIFEPVCTHPDHRGKDLARDLMLEGLRRLYRRGGREATVGTGDADPANRLYEAVGFDEAHRGRVWSKSLPPAAEARE